MALVASLGIFAVFALGRLAGDADSTLIERGIDIKVALAPGTIGAVSADPASLTQAALATVKAHVVVSTPFAFFTAFIVFALFASISTGLADSLRTQIESIQANLTFTGVLVTDITFIYLTIDTLTILKSTEVPRTLSAHHLVDAVEAVPSTGLT